VSDCFTIVRRRTVNLALVSPKNLPDLILGISTTHLGFVLQSNRWVMLKAKPFLIGDVATEWLHPS
jgi:hypothetical protein